MYVGLLSGSGLNGKKWSPGDNQCTSMGYEYYYVDRLGSVIVSCCCYVDRQVMIHGYTEGGMSCVWGMRGQ